MINSIKDLVQMSKQLQRLNEKIEGYHQEIDSLNEAVGGLKKEVDGISKSTKEIKDEASSAVSAINREVVDLRKTNEQFKKSIYDFTVIKKEIQKDILSKFDTKLKEELVTTSRELRHSVNDYNELRDGLKSTSKEVEEISSKCIRLQKIMDQVKEQDFQCVDFTKKVEDLSREKLSLLRKLDSMERLVARSRRK
jgi:chromosome segregation ATPase